MPDPQTSSVTKSSVYQISPYIGVNKVLYGIGLETNYPINMNLLGRKGFTQPRAQQDYL